MLSSLHIKNFKAAQDLPLRLGSLTLLAGLNGSGKSTVLQALAVLKQSYLGRDATGLRLRGPLVQLGTYRDVRSEGAETDQIEIEVIEGGVSFHWSAEAEMNSAFLPFSVRPDQLPAFLRPGNFQLLPADRIVPRNSFARNPDVESDMGPLGPRGEFVVEYLLSETARQFEVSSSRLCPREGHDLSEELLLKASPTSSLTDQVSGWLQQLSPGVRVSAEELLGTDEVVLHYDYVGRTGVRESSQKLRPSNVGFGLTYSLPLVVACLMAPAGSILLLENPEAHLHPQGQAALGELIVRAARDGVQVLVETHSDHVLNGVRLAVKRGLIPWADVVVHYFSRAVETGIASAESPAILDDGRLSNWPRGFFDQWDKAIDALVED